MIKYSELIRSEIERIRYEGALTPLQSRIFDVLLAGRMTRETAASELGMSYNKFHLLELELKKKIERILAENRGEKPPNQSTITQS